MPFALFLAPPKTGASDEGLGVIYLLFNIIIVIFLIFGIFCQTKFEEEGIGVTSRLVVFKSYLRKITAEYLIIFR